MKWTEHWIVQILIGLLILHILLWLVMVYHNRIDNKINSKKCTTLGIITHYETVRRHITYTYVYSVNNKQIMLESDRDETDFVRRCKKGKKKPANEIADCLNRVFIVEYVCDDPTTSRILLDQPLPDTLRTLP